MTDATPDRWEGAWRALRANIQRADRLAQLGSLDVEELGGSVVDDAFSPRADLSRAQIVFLHAACEDFIRVVSKRPKVKWCLNSANNARVALERAGLSNERLDLACVWLGELAARRVQIVHFADGPAPDGHISAPWRLGDTYQLLGFRLSAYLLLTETLLCKGRAVEWATARSVIFFDSLEVLTSWGVRLVQASERGENLVGWVRENSEAWIAATRDLRSRLPEIAGDAEWSLEAP